MLVALLVTDGVSADECEAFTLVFERIPRCELVRVGNEVGSVAGPGGAQRVDATFADVRHPDIVLVPGGLGCRRTAADDHVLAWLRAVAPTCAWMVASSTGTVVVAAAGLLDHHEAATHWLASPLLESYGSHASEQRIVEIDRIITCAGHVTALHVALIVTLRVFGPEMVDEVRAGIAASRQAGDVDDRRPFARWRRRREPTAAPRPSNPELVAPDVIAFDEPIVTRAGRSASQGR